MLKTALFAAACALLLGACASNKKVSYLQDLQTGVPIESVNPQKIKIQPDDELSIVVSGKDRSLTELYNLPYVTRQLGQSGGASSPQGILGYTVDGEGCIDFPILGRLEVAGKTRTEVAALIKRSLTEKNYIKDCVVTVSFLNLTVSVLGEVNRPGRYDIDKDHYTILDAISAASDLTVYGRRDAVTVVRTNADGQQVPYTVDLRSAKDLYSSPVYYLQQNDVVYVEPNMTRARQSTANGNNVISASFWLSVASLLTTIAVLVFR